MDCTCTREESNEWPPVATKEDGVAIQQRSSTLSKCLSINRHRQRKKRMHKERLILQSTAAFLYLSMAQPSHDQGSGL